MARSSSAKTTKKARSSLAARLGAGAPERATRPLGIATTAPQLSKSAQRRRKHRQREQLAGNETGMQDLAEVVTSLEDTLPGSDVEDAVPGARAVTAKSRRGTLYVWPLTRMKERARLPYILSDMHKTGNPFGALRTHARNTLGLGSRAAPTADDVEMAPSAP